MKRYSFSFPSAPSPPSNNFYVRTKSHLSSHEFSKHLRRTRISLPPFPFPSFLLIESTKPFHSHIDLSWEKNPTIIPVRILLLMALKEFGWYGEIDRLLKFLYCWHPPWWLICRQSPSCKLRLTDLFRMCCRSQQVSQLSFLLSTWPSLSPQSHSHGKLGRNSKWKKKTQKDRGRRIAIVLDTMRVY